MIFITFTEATTMVTDSRLEQMTLTICRKNTDCSFPNSICSDAYGAFSVCQCMDDYVLTKSSVCTQGNLLCFSKACIRRWKFLRHMALFDCPLLSSCNYSFQQDKLYIYYQTVYVFVCLQFFYIQKSLLSLEHLSSAIERIASNINNHQHLYTLQQWRFFIQPYCEKLHVI